MKSGVKQLLQFIVFFGLGVSLMYWQFSRFKPEEKAQFFTALKTANYDWFAIAVVIGALAHLSRAIRWRQTLSPLEYKVGLGSRFYAVMLGYMANYGIPRSGEFIRCGALKGTDDVPFAESFGTVVLERIVDTLCLGLVFLLVLVFEFAQLSSMWIEYIWDPAMKWKEHLFQNTKLMSVLIVGIILFVSVLFIFRKKIRNIIGKKVGGFFTGFKNGLLAIKKLPSPGAFIFHSLFIWSGYLGSLYVCFFCFPSTHGLTINSALILLLFGTFGVIFTPGGIGAYQIIVTAILIRIVPSTTPDAAPFAWLSWGAQVGTVILFFGISAVLKNTLNRTTK
ncbi:MAG TPA: lysylphosphatidylglycerol synthase transmembrane domain-containing protein [Bacteroidia bacterium]|nr:lysylphosphatidylglycerol synthase transmembrane domain-containing protein [Bacteroidia bacterium]